MKTKVKKRKVFSTGIERICSHYIEWRLEGKGNHLWDSDIEHIKNLLIENDMSGELRTLSSNGTTVYGWWNIQM